MEQKWRSIGLGALLVLLTMVAYGAALRAGFFWDDDQHLTANRCIIGPSGLRGIWTTSSAVYYPLVLTSFWIQHAIWGLNPFFYHLVNVLMHAINAILLWRVLLRLGLPAAWFGAALWALHPVQVESVAWVTELKNVQSCFFYLLAILFFLKWRAVAGRVEKAVLDYALVIFFAALAILSKASTVMLPVVLALCWWWKERRWRWRNTIWLLPFFIMSAAASAWTVWEQRFHSRAQGEEWSQADWNVLPSRARRFGSTWASSSGRIPLCSFIPGGSRSFQSTLLGTAGSCGPGVGRYSGSAAMKRGCGQVFSPLATFWSHCFR